MSKISDEEWGRHQRAIDGIHRRESDPSAALGMALIWAAFVAGIVVTLLAQWVW